MPPRPGRPTRRPISRAPAQVFLTSLQSAMSTTPVHAGEDRLGHHLAGRGLLAGQVRGAAGLRGHVGDRRGVQRRQSGGKRPDRDGVDRCRAGSSSSVRDFVDLTPGQAQTVEGMGPLTPPQGVPVTLTVTVTPPAGSPTPTSPRRWCSRCRGRHSPTRPTTVPGRLVRYHVSHLDHDVGRPVDAR